MKTCIFTLASTYGIYNWPPPAERSADFDFAGLRFPNGNSS